MSDENLILVCDGSGVEKGEIYVQGLAAQEVRFAHTGCASFITGSRNLSGRRQHIHCDIEQLSHFNLNLGNIHEGGADNRKGHMTLTTYDLCAGIAVDSNTETASIDEMRFVKEVWIASWWTSRKNAIYVVDRAFIEAHYWDQRKTGVNATVIT